MDHIEGSLRILRLSHETEPEPWRYEISFAPYVASSCPPACDVYAHVLSGAIRSQVDDAPAKVYRVGEGFYEVPGSHHRVSENASDREPASLLAVIVVDSKDIPLTIPDQK